MQTEHIELLVLYAQTGDQNALEKLYAHFLTPMRRYAILRVKDVMVAEDMVQNVWVKVDKRVRYLHDVSLFRSWLYKALRWEILDWHKKYQNQDLTEPCEFDATPTDKSHVGAIEKALDLIPLLNGLAEDERDVVELYYLNDLSLAETALALDLPHGTVKSRLARARDKLRKAYQ